jgi:uncharacterized protein
VIAAFDDLPPSASWRHRGVREGFETVFFCNDGSGYRCEGVTAAVEDGQAWAVRYAILLDSNWRATAASVWCWTDAGAREIRIEAVAVGRWQIDDKEIPEVAGCLDIDLESSACTNTMPVHRLNLDVGDAARAPALYVRANGLAVERLDQLYRRVADDGDRLRFDYRAAAFEFEARLVYDRSGLILDYPGVAARAS